MMAKGKDNKLFSNTIETSLRDPDFVDFFASSITHRRVSYYRKQIQDSSSNLGIIGNYITIDSSSKNFESQIKMYNLIAEYGKRTHRLDVGSAIESNIHTE